MNSAQFFKRTIGATLVVVAIAWSGPAAWAAPKVGTTVVGAQAPDPVTAGSPATYTVTVNRGSGGGSSGAFDADMSISNSLPPGYIVSFSPNPLNFTPSDNSKISILTVTPPLCASATNISLAVQCTKNGTSSDFAVGFGTLVVSASGTGITCNVTGPGPVCPLTTNLTYTATTSASTPTFLWSISGNGNITGPATNSTVKVNATTAGSFTINVTITDTNSFCVSSCGQTVTVGDSTPPNITQCATNILGTANASCQAAVPNFTNAVVASDNCSAITISQSPTIGTLVGSGTNTVTISVADINGNTNTCTASFIVRDLTAPNITQCATNILGTADASCQAAVPNFTNAVVASDSCGIAAITQSPTIGTLVGSGTNNVTITVADPSGNTNSCTAKFIVFDATAPNISQCATNQQASLSGGATLPVPDFTGGVTASDNCGGVSVAQSPVVGTLVGLGPHTITLTVTDGSGNSAQCQATFTVVDNTPPSISQCATNQSAEAGSGCQAAVPDFTGQVVASDNSGSVTITQNPLAGTLVAFGTNTVTLTATDGSSNSTNCTVTFTVTDTTAPSISACSAGVTVSTDAGTNVATNVDLGAAPTASDLCGIGSITSNAPAAFPLGTNVVTWTVTDTHGNSTNCQQNVIVVDTEPPLLTCPTNIFINLVVGQCSITNLDIGTPVVSDNVGVASVVNDAPATFNAGTNQVIWTATDTSGNSAVCTQIVAVLDVTPPLISELPPAQQSSAGAGCQAAVPDYASSVVAVDDCTGSNSLTVTQSPTAGTLVGTGTNVVTITVADSAGNSTQSNVDFIVVDDTPPQITTCATNQQTSADGSGNATVPDFAGGVVASDNCGSNSLTVTQSPTAGTIVGIGTNTIALTVIDGSGNSNTCTATFTVDDTTPPQITQCAGDQSAEAGAGCQATVPDFTAGVSASDNSGSVTITQDPLAGSSANVGTNTVTLTATDGTGNFTNCTAQFIVTDTNAPAISQCAADLTVNTDAGTNFASNVNLGAPVASDVCGIASTTSNAPATFPLGTNVVTWTVTDIHGNQANCQQLVIVVDNEAPLIACPANITTNLPAGDCTVTNLDLGTPVTSDNVGVASIVNDSPTTFSTGTNVVEWTVTDFQGNSAVCTQLVVVLNVSAPVIDTLPSDQTASPAAGCQAAVPDFTSGVSASDDCSASNTLTVTQSPTAGTLVGPGTNAVTLVVADASGNTATGSVDFIVVDTTAPDITQCSANQQGSSGTNGTVAVPDFTSGLIATDNCSGSLTVTQSPTAGTLVGAGTHTITLTVTDDLGNSNTCTAAFVVDDTTPPQITQCAGNQSVSAGTNCQAAIPDLTGGVTATDDSGVPPTITQSPVAGTLVGLGTNTVTLTATDVSSNSVQCTAQVVVSDTTVPLITCPGNIVVTAPVGSNSVSGVNLGSPTASDNCGAVTVTNDAPASFPIGNTIVTWTADDGNGNTSTCQQTVTVAGSNIAPIANDDSYTVAEDDALDVAAPGVLTNDTDAELDSLTAILVSTTTNGVLTLNADGSFTYVPDDNFNGTDSFTYKANDGSLDSSNATVTITVTSVNGAGDIDLYAKSESFGINWAMTGHDRFKISGKINPRGATNDLTGATMQISINGTNIFAPVTLSSTGVGSATVGSTKIKAKLSSATGQYSYTISGLDLRNIIGLPNTTGTGFTPLDVVLTIQFADLQVTPVSGILETSFKTTAGKTTKGKFVFKSNRTLTGAFNWNKTTAAQAKDGSFKVTGKGVAENEGGSGIAPTGNIRVTMGGSVFTLPAANVKFALNGTSRTFKISASGLTASGIPLASANAPTVHELPIMFEVPVIGGTNIFETIIELKRPTGTTTKWKR